MVAFNYKDIENKNILITGYNGFIGKNLTEKLKASGCKNLMLYDINTGKEQFENYCKSADFVFHLAGVNRPKDASEFYKGNTDLTQMLLNLIAKTGRKVPVLITSSAQVGNGSDYGKSKEEAEKILIEYKEKTGSDIYIYRLPGVFGKWSRPNYNTVVATFCHNIANGLPVQVNDENAEINLVYVDDVVNAFISVLFNKANCNPEMQEYCRVQPVYQISLGNLAKLIKSFKESRQTLQVPISEDEFTQKLYATYLSFLPEDDFSYKLKMNVDERGSFTEFLRSNDKGQVSVNISKPGICKGNHWHNTKNEKFLVVSGTGIIRFRKIGESGIIEYKVSGDELTVVDIPTGYTHNIENTGKTDMVTLMWASEAFDPENPDTYFEKV